MSLIQFNNIYKEFSGELLLNNISFNINEQDRIGIVGINGSGKSTLIKMLLGIEDFDYDPKTHKAGNINCKSGIKIGYLSQDSKLEASNSVFEELMAIYDLKDEYIQIQKLINNNDGSSLDNQEKLLDLINEYEQKEGYKVENDIKQILYGLNLNEDLWYKEISSLSGGQRTTVALAKTLLQEPDLLVLDEPTNHLDLSAIEWLENLLNGYNKALIVISHDTYFLDNTVTTIFEIENKRLTIYSGNYSDYVIQKKIYLSGALKAYTKQQDKISKLKEFVLKYKAGQKSKQARGRQKMLDNMEKSDNPIIPVRKMKLKMKVDMPSGMQVLRLENLEKSFGNNLLFKNLNIDIFKGNRIGLIGKNGVGKSTILKIIMGLMSQDSGDVIFGEKLKIGYYDQNHQNLDRSNTILEEIRNNFDITEEQARNIAGSFLFTGDDITKPVSALSGGERARVSLIKLILSKPNFLIMDEPTNHLDIYSKEILEEALEGYDGTILLVSHDRHFLEVIVDKIYLINHDGATAFDGNYSQYMLSKNAKISSNKKKLEGESKANHQNDDNLKNSLNNTDSLQNNSKGNSKISYDERKKINNKITSLEKQIKSCKSELKSLQEQENILYEKSALEGNEIVLAKIQKEIDSIHFQSIDLQNKIAILKNEIEELQQQL